MIERTYVVPLRKGWLKAPRYRRAKKAVNTLRAFLVRHMKSENVLLMTDLNLELWKHGMKNPPSRVKITVQKDDKGVVKAQLFGSEMPKEVVEEAPKSAMKKMAEKVTGKAAPKQEMPKTEAPKAAPKQEAPKTEAKPAPKSAPKPEAKKAPAKA